MKSESRELKKRPQLEVYNRRIETGGREMWRERCGRRAGGGGEGGEKGVGVGGEQGGGGGDKNKYIDELSEGGVGRREERERGKEGGRVREGE